MSLSQSLPRPQRPAVRLEVREPPRRKTPTAWSLARRRWMIGFAKRLLPLVSLALLASIAMWPEIVRLTDRARLGVARLTGEIQTGMLSNPVYHGVDARDRPYTLTALRAHETSAERVNLTLPKADVLLDGGRWLMVQAKRGVFREKINDLDLSGDVTLYRDDGLTMITDTANLDLKSGAAASADRVHAEGPFGTLDAQGFTVLDRGTAVQFAGPGRLVLNANR
jgi:lipopolysaccharide export system protein LptC